MLPFDSMGQVLEINDIFQDGQLKTHCFSGAVIFNVTVTLPKESEHSSEETHLIKKPGF